MKRFLLYNSYSEYILRYSLPQTNDPDSDDALSAGLTADDLAGVFLLLAGGAAVAVLLALLECCWRSAALAREKQVNHHQGSTINLENSLQKP